MPSEKSPQKTSLPSGIKDGDEWYPPFRNPDPKSRGSAPGRVSPRYGPESEVGEVRCADMVGAAATVGSGFCVGVAGGAVCVSVGTTVASTFPQPAVKRVKTVTKKNRLQVDMFLSQGVLEKLALETADAEEVNISVHITGQSPTGGLCHPNLSRRSRFYLD